MWSELISCSQNENSGKLFSRKTIFLNFAPAGKILDWLSWRISGTHKIQRISSSYKGLDKMRRIEQCLINSNHQELQVILFYSTFKF